MFKNTEQIIQKFTSNVEDKRADYLKHENSNYVYSLPLLRHNIHNYAEEAYLFKHILPPRLKELYDDGSIYVHDKQLAPYCVSISCLDIATKGIPALAKNMIESKPTKRLSILLRHFSNVVTLVSQQVSGAVMLAQLSTITASYLYDEETHGVIYEADDLKQLFQSMIWELNMPLRSGAQSSFSNVTLEFGKPSEEIKDEYVVIGGELRLMQYKDIPSEYFDRINKAIIDVMSDGTGSGGIPFTFPLLTVQVDDDFNYENPLFLKLLDKMYNWGGVYFENFKTKPFEDPYYKVLNPLIQAKDPEVSRSLCCRLQINLKTISKAGGGVFGSSTGSTGAVQVLNLNMNRILLEFGHDMALVKRKIKEYMEVMQEGHMAKRSWIESHKELYPTFFAYNDNLKNYFNVFAVTGMNEGIINLGYQDGIKDNEGKMVAHELMQYMTEIVNSFIVRDKVACGIEYAPAENAAIKLARHDVKWAKVNNRAIFTQGEGDNPYLTSGCMTPFSEEDFFAQLENSAEFQGYATSGSVLHHFLESKVAPEKLATYLDKIFEKPINYITLTPTITSCMSCGQKIIAEDAKNIHHCPTCDATDIATFSRVIGYLKMIARNNIQVDEKGYYKGKYNFWSKARRHDWNVRHRLKEEVLQDVARQ
ncbi:ribonucleoside-triphosphate reductase [Virgibacillus dakarensis]|uniref:anaerobic ribonucleoside-triphosphate reductase n=1 Tax=Virgibacillus dakarensis TaxID=1917889 RepID=UPI000B441B63|nr:anaerobic ribonucleoside-triphosphate reductase [Virgibacillus dakarensis]MBT2217704.1 ribonucleoside-triphosphate reductase [Virgibacillus dakarensis]MTW88285.1 ribonucleoside-triphosphate reductase [Virgibacillus dakarensis]